MIARHRAKVAVLISGSGTNMAALLYASRIGMSGAGVPYDIVLVASNDSNAGGLALAEAEGIATFALSHKGMDRAAHDAAMDTAIRESGAEFVALAGYMRVLGEEMVARWEGRMLNIHPSLLPKYKGLDTHARALEAGDEVAGASVHLVTTELDGGEVLGRSEVAVVGGDTPETLALRVKMAEHQLYPRVLADYVSRPYDPEWLLKRVSELALALPEAEAATSHGSPGFKLSGKNGKFFAHFADRHHGAKQIALLAKTSGQDELADLVERDPEVFFRPAYYHATGWVGIALNRSDCDWDQVEHWLERSWRSVAPRRLTKLMGAAEEF
ncbi:phosphoribosylglycinamide formyltransferase [Alteriqipengyuania lutimaris]|uniref:Phosphoribosylglycinamide formyltransferase n=1 Tax=Alteriqipengyuania lutimaris TaxID=1538146 RepID=A0A395LH20_9SPHN|nr:phosphoribosylglycinamide formyltransferase [Alteriqipengyuania lutimaris]MBB3035548.1 phosphoribosylglycinamide formyltransferase-1 [Alteriqipengyuania lutimaris]RDS76102.1 phosphoribosylglycinamide formyltransferase [Alteriqipengyuania lutimaris]